LNEIEALNCQGSQFRALASNGPRGWSTPRSATRRRRAMSCAPSFLTLRGSMQPPRRLARQRVGHELGQRPAKGCRRRRLICCSPNLSGWGAQCSMQARSPGEPCRPCSRPAPCRLAHAGILRR